MPQNATENKNSLTRRQQGVLPILAAAPSIAEAARQSNLDRGTLHRWLQDDHFRQELQRIRQEAADLARSELNVLMFRSVAVLAECLDDPNPDLRLRAARTALSYAVKVHDIQQLHHQIQAIENARNAERSQ